VTETFYRGFLNQVRHDIAQDEAEETRLKAELTVVQSRLAEKRHAAASVARLLGQMTNSPEEAEELGRLANEQPTRHADIAEQVLRTVGRPLRVPEIGTRMMQLGHPVPEDARIRDAAVYSALARRPNIFYKVARGLWGLQEWLSSPNGKGGLNFDDGPSKSEDQGQ
jgi:hypothetical protein